MGLAKATVPLFLTWVRLFDADRTPIGLNHVSQKLTAGALEGKACDG